MFVADDPVRFDPELEDIEDMLGILDILKVKDIDVCLLQATPFGSISSSSGGSLKKPTSKALAPGS